MKKIILLSFLFLFNLPVFAATWRQVDEKIYVDIDSIEQYTYKYNFDNNLIYSFWIKSLNNKSQFFLDDEKHYNKKIWYKLVKMLINCSDKTIAVKSVATYGLQKQVIDSFEISEYEMQWSSIIPESLGEVYYNNICLP